MRVTVLNGPNLNLLGTREPEIYGTTTLRQIEALVREETERLGASIRFLQTNHEGTLVDVIQVLPGSADALIMNARVYPHTSLAIRDALLAVKVPFVEVHLTDVAAREEMRRRLLFADLAVEVITGQGPEGYRKALQVLWRRRGERLSPPGAAGAAPVQASRRWPRRAPPPASSQPSLPDRVFRLRGASALYPRACGPDHRLPLRRAGPCRGRRHRPGAHGAQRPLGASAAARRAGATHAGRVRAGASQRSPSRAPCQAQERRSRADHRPGRNVPRRERSRRSGPAQRRGSSRSGGAGRPAPQRSRRANGAGDRGPTRARAPQPGKRVASFRNHRRVRPPQRASPCPLERPPDRPRAGMGKRDRKSTRLT